MKRLNQAESPIFVILCVLCFQRQSFLTFIESLAGSYLRISEICTNCSLSRRSALDLRVRTSHTEDSIIWLVVVSSM